MSFWPNKGQSDLRPPLGSSYAPIAAVVPLHPAVPEAAPGALRLPIVGVSAGRHVAAEKSSGNSSTPA
jgi:cholesterol oxidase